MATKVKMRVLRVGKHKDSAGREIEITDKKIKAIADGFSFSGVEDAAPDIISHDNKSPRVGFIRKVYSGDDGNSLFAESELHDDFAQAISEGYYPGVSVRLSRDENKILHVAHLGKEKPAIKGLGLPIFDFAESKDESVVDFAEVNLELLEQVTDIWAREIRDALWKSQEQQRSIFEAIKTALGDKQASNFSEGDGMDKDLQARLLKENEELKSQFKAIKEKEASDFAEGLIAEGKIMPRQKDGVVKDYLTTQNESDFAEMKKSYSDLPVSPLFTPATKPDAGKAASDFSSQELAELAVDYQGKLEKEGKKISMTDAVAFVRKGK
jgi:hypothetical protein